MDYGRNAESAETPPPPLWERTGNTDERGTTTTGLRKTDKRHLNEPKAAHLESDGNTARPPTHRRLWLFSLEFKKQKKKTIRLSWGVYPTAQTEVDGAGLWPPAVPPVSLDRER